MPSYRTHALAPAQREQALDLLRAVPLTQADREQHCQHLSRCKEACTTIRSL
jgi:hypothetical protein